MSYITVLDQDFDVLNDWQSNPTIRYITGKKAIERIYKDVVLRLGDFRYNGKRVVPSMNMIQQALTIAYQTYKPNSGNPTTFNIYEPGDEYDPETILETATNIIVNDIYTTYEQPKINNESFNAWNRILGDYNEAGVRQYSEMKLNDMGVQDVYASINL